MNVSQILQQLLITYNVVNQGLISRAEVLAWEQATDWTDEVLEVEATDGH